MGELNELIKLNLKVNGNGLADNYKNNSLYFYNMYQKSDPDVKSISVKDIQLGGFYFLHYLDDSNWMKYSPIFTIEYKKFNNQLVLLALNFNFIPIQIRGRIFDKYIIKEDFEKDRLLKVDYEGMYRELLRLGFEYALVEYNMIQIKKVHKISLNLLPRFLYAGHPINKYDPPKLMQIWEAKIEKKAERHQEIVKSVLDEFYDVEKDFSDKYDLLSDHISRLQKSMEKYGK